MPELPEVETVVNYLKENILNQNIIHVSVLGRNLLKNCSPIQFCKNVTNSKITNIIRKGKNIIFLLSNKQMFIAHLRMSGKFILIQNDKENLLGNTHTALIFNFDIGGFFYNDVRHFGTIHLFNHQNYEKCVLISKLGPDAISSMFDLNYLASESKKSKKMIKTFLLDQTKVAGIGNIYVDEILFRAKIHPETKTNQISNKKLKLVVEYTKLILQDSINHKGTTIQSYSYDGHNPGEYLKYLKIHTKAGQKCQNCETIIIKIRVNQRGTYYCPKCQLIEKC